MSYLNLSAIDDPMERAVARATYDPDWFCDDVLLCPNDIWQSEVLNAMADLDRARVGIPTVFNHDLKNRISCVAFHGPGKTHAMAKAMHWFNFTRKGRIPCTGPKEKSLTTRTWPEFRKILSGATDFYKQLIKVKATKIEWCKNPDWCAIVESANRVENLSGYHDKNLLFLVEEASGVDNEMFPAIEGALTTEGSILLMIGNPIRTSGEFYDSHNKKSTKEQYYLKKIKHSETTRVTKKWVDSMVKKYGRDSPIVKSRVFGEWVKGSKNQVIAYEWLEAALLQEYKEEGSAGKLVIAADVADGGIDSSVITVMYFYKTVVRLVKQFKYNYPASESPILVAKKCIEIFKLYNGKKENDKIVVDGIGVGAGTAGYLFDQGYKKSTVVFKGGSSSNKKTKFRNKRSQCFISFKNAAMRSNLFIEEDFVENESDWEEFCDQVCKLQYQMKNEKLEDVETKESYVNREGKSPDRADSVMMGFAVKYFSNSITSSIMGDNSGIINVSEVV